MTVLVTGVAGFIGYHVARALLDRGETVIGIDDLNAYYDIRLKQARLDRLIHPGFHFRCADISLPQTLADLAATAPEIDRIVHLAAQAGVRYSLQAPFAYAKSNLIGHLSVLEMARRLPRLRHLVYASSSSVYGSNPDLPWRETAPVDAPLSLYAATKRADELISHAYTHLFDLPQTGLRFFTVYGPWGRPDMAYFTFAEAILEGRPITVYDGGRPRRDFTYIDDIVAGVLGVLAVPPNSGPPRVFNIGNHQAEAVSTLIAYLEQALGREAVTVAAPRPKADPSATYAAIENIAELTGFAPRTPLDVGIPLFCEWLLAWRQTRARLDPVEPAAD